MIYMYIKRTEIKRIQQSIPEMIYYFQFDEKEGFEVCEYI